MTARAETRTARERILNAAASLFARRGYYNSNVDEIVQQSGTSKGSFYFHFPSKEQMALGMVDQLSDKLVRKLERSIASEPDPAEEDTAGDRRAAFDLLQAEETGPDTDGEHRGAGAFDGPEVPADKGQIRGADSSGVGWRRRRRG